MPLDYAMDDIISMFPVSEPSWTQSDPYPAPYPQLSYDPLFGFMNTLL